MALDTLGISFQPNEENATLEQGGLQEAVKLLNLRLPSVMGAQSPVAPQLLNATGLQGQPDFQFLKQLLGLGGMTPPSSQPRPSSQGPMPQGGPGPVSGPEQLPGGNMIPLPTPPPAPRAPRPETEAGEWGRGDRTPRRPIPPPRIVLPRNPINNPIYQ